MTTKSGRPHEFPNCRYNNFVGCKRMLEPETCVCDKCGWNPDEEQRRKVKLGITGIKK